MDQAKENAELAALEQEFEQYRDIKLDLGKSEDDYKKEITKYERFMATMGTSVNLRALDIYDAVEKEYSGLTEKKKVLLGERDDVVKMMKV